MKYVTFDENGNLTGAFTQSLHPAHAAAHIEVSDAEYSNWTGYKANQTRDGLEVAPVPVPAIQIPQVVSRAQFILALLQIDLLDEVEAAIAQADRATQINYNERLEFERSFPLIATMAAVLGRTDAEIDALFVLAATL